MNATTRPPRAEGDRTDLPGDRFEPAADAVVAGDERTLTRLLDADASLARARSSRPHHATLLHYVSANGVEDARQQTPANIVRITRCLIEHDADVDAIADTYGGGPDQTTLNLVVSSVHPARAGQQVALVETLLEAGAAREGVDRSGSPLLTALAFHYPDPAAALVARGASVETLLAAAGVGREDLVRAFVREDGTLDPSARVASVASLRLPSDARAQAGLALIWAAALGHAPVVDVLARRGVDLTAQDHQGFTALHWAAVQGQQVVIDLLIARGAPLDVRNSYGATPLGAARWASQHTDGVFHSGRLTPVDYSPITAALVAAGAAP